MHPCRIVYDLAGSPPQEIAEDHPAICAVCGHPSDRTAVYARWQGANFTDQNKLASLTSGRVCEACVWAHAWNAPPGYPPPDPGKKGLCLRLFSHLWHDGEYLALNKASKPRILEWLRSPKPGPWFAGIADSGQKHILPWTPLNAAGTSSGMIRFEDRNLSLPSTPEGWQIVDRMTELLTLAATKEEIELGSYSARALLSAEEAVLSFEEDHGSGRGGAWFALALWLAQRDEEKCQALRKERDAKKRAREGAHRTAGRPRARRAGSVPGGVSESLVETLGSNPGAAKGKRQNLGDTLGNDHLTAAVAEYSGPEQGNLFGGFGD